MYIHISYFNIYFQHYFESVQYQLFISVFQLNGENLVINTKVEEQTVDNSGTCGKENCCKGINKDHAQARLKNNFTNSCKTSSSEDFTDNNGSNSTSTCTSNGSSNLLSSIKDSTYSISHISSNIPGLASVYIRTWGCAHNSSDSEYMAGQLAAYGYDIIGQYL